MTLMTTDHDHSAGSVCPEHGPIDERGEFGKHICDVLVEAWRASPKSPLRVSSEHLVRWHAHCDRLGWSYIFSGCEVAASDGTIR